MANPLVSRSMEREYLAIERFTEENDKISYLQFDSYTTQKVNLFALPEHERFRQIERLADRIISALPAFKRILSKPITRLKDVTNVLPIEAVRVINNATMGHIAIHTELWGNVTKEGLKPRKLMTLSHEEDYKLYENIAFTRLIDIILSFVRKNARLLKDVMYSCKPLHFNLLERTNHLMHFLAIGKLHVGYAHAQDRYHLTHQRCLEKLTFIEKTLIGKLHSPVYRICKKDHSKITLKKTNIFRLQKDYIQVYQLLKKFAEKDDGLNEQNAVEALPEKAYASYCALLSVFAAGHFNFTFNEKDKLEFNKFSASCSFKKWKLSVEKVQTEGVCGIQYKMKKDTTYTVTLILYRNQRITEAELAAFKKKHRADEYLFTEPSEFGAKNGVYLSLFDISSFRRIQQILLRAMVYSDKKRDTCPFCGSPLERHEGGFECSLCRTYIREHTCPDTGENYFITELKDYKIPHLLAENGSSIYSDKESEALLFYRNITPISKKGKPLCPHCGKAH